MEKVFDVLVHEVPGGGCEVQALDVPNFTAFAASREAARFDLSTALSHALKHGHIPLWEVTHFDSLLLRRLQLDLRAMQGDRLLPVPIKVTVLHHRLNEDDDSPWRVRIPRLDLEFELRNLDDLELVAEERVRHELFLEPLENVLHVAAHGEERLEQLVVKMKGAVIPEKRRPDSHDLPSTATLPPVLGDVCVALNEEARQGHLGRAYQRQAELAALKSELLTRRSVVLVGATGVGKTALVHEVTQEMVSAGSGSALHGWEFFSTSGARIVAGMHYLGQWQERVEGLLAVLRSRRAVLLIENLQELLQTGDHATGLDLASYLLPALRSRELVLVVEATPTDLAAAQRTHSAFVHALRPILLRPLPSLEAEQALRATAARLRKDRGVRCSSAAIVEASALAQRFDAESALPGSAIRLLTETAQRMTEGQVKEGVVAEPTDVIQAFCARSGYPRKLVDLSEPFDPAAVQRELDERVVGQPEATELLKDLVVTLRAGLLEGERPLGSFLLLGPTGVGKTESAKALAELFFGDPQRMVRFDMAEYCEPASARRLLMPHEGSLVSRVRQRPFGIVLLDEIEKADGSVHDLLLQLLGEGRLSDIWGRTVSFRNTVVFMTSNLGASEEGRLLGFATSGDTSRSDHYLAAAREFFRPELVNRIDHVIPYRPLSRDAIRRIAGLLVRQALEREGFTRRDLHIEVDESLFEHVAATGFDPRYGARPLKRAIERALIVPLARYLAASGPLSVSRWRVTVREGETEVTPR